MEGIVNPEDFMLASITKWNRRRKTIEESAQMFTDIISGKGNEAQNNVVCANEWLSQR
jgi:anthranilate phosphoribosyltransferase